MSVSGLAALMFGLVLLASPCGGCPAAWGRWGGGAAGGENSNSRSIICLHDCPALRGGLSGEDDLKDFRRAIALQATEEQRAAFARILQYTQSAADQLKTFTKLCRKSPLRLRRSLLLWPIVQPPSIRRLREFAPATRTFSPRFLTRKNPA